MNANIAEWPNGQIWAWDGRVYVCNSLLELQKFLIQEIYFHTTNIYIYFTNWKNMYICCIKMSYALTE